MMWSFQWYRDIVSFIFDAEVKRGAPIWRIVRATFWHLCGNVFKDRHFYRCPDRELHYLSQDIGCILKRKKITIVRYRKFHRLT